MKYRRYGRVAAGLYAGGRKMLRMRYRYRGGRTRTKRRYGRSGQGVTSQYDKKTVYVKKRMPYRKRKAWGRFNNKVAAVLDKSLGTRSIVFNETITTAVNAQQTLAYAHLYPQNGLAPGVNNNETGCNDIARMLDRDALSTDSKIHFKSAVMDLTFNGYPEGTADSWPMEVDAYEIVYRKANYPQSFNNLLATCELATQTATGYTSGLILGQRGVTPFELPLLGKSGVKVLKKTKYFLTPENTTFTYQIRDPKNRYLSGTVDLHEANNTEFVLGGWTRTVLFVIKLIPGVTPIEGSGVAIGVTRKYAYTKNAVNETEDGYL